VNRIFRVLSHCFLSVRSVRQSWARAHADAATDLLYLF
jgi:hypothetical protein